MKRIEIWLTAMVIGAFQCAPPVAAQTTEPMTEAEMIAAFDIQKELGLPRGLSIVPTVDPATVDPTAPAPQVVVAELPAEQQVNIRISFDFDSSALRADQEPLLVALCNAMKKTDVQLFQIIGHTDSSGTASYNETLSQLRAEEVKRHLESNCGIPAEKMEAVGVGARYPYDPVNPRADVNRRVEFQALS